MKSLLLTFEWLPVLLLLPFPLLIKWFWPKAERLGSGALRVPFFDNIQEVTREQKLKQVKRDKKWLPRWIWFLLVLTAAHPMWRDKPIPLTTKGRDIMFAVDLSDSMHQTDLTWKGEAVDRLTVIKNVLSDFIDHRTGDRMGLILFGSNAYLQVPLTFDKDTTKKLLDEAQIGMAGPTTAIGDAIGLAIKRLHDRPENSRMLILLTDGANNSGEVDPLQAAQLAQEEHLKIYTIGVGAEEIVLKGLLFGTRRMNPSSDLDEVTLTKIAKMTGGKYFRAKNTETMQEIYQEIDQLEPVDADEQMFIPQISLFQYPLALAFLLSLYWSVQIVWQNKPVEEK